MRRLATAFALGLAFSGAGCDEKKSGGQGAKLGGNLLPPLADGTAGSSTAGRPIVRSPETERKVEELRDSVASAYAPSTAGRDPGRQFFDGQRALGDAGETLPVAADGALGAKGVRYQYTSNPRRVSTRITDTPRPGTLPDVDLPDADPGAAGGGPVLRAFDAFQKRSYDAVVAVLSRQAWGAGPRSGAPTAHRPGRVTVHHTSGHPQTGLSQGISAMRGIQSFHQNGRGWADIGYHFVLDSEGRIYEGRPADTVGAHAGGANTGNIGIALMGDYNDKPSRKCRSCHAILNEQQKSSLRRLVTFLALHYRTDPRQNGFVLGHTQHPGNDTDCPGQQILRFLAILQEQVSAETLKLVARYRPGASGFQPLAVVDA